MAALTEAEWACVRRYVALLAERLADRLVRVDLVGSGARGDMWPAGHPIPSDVDLLVVTSARVPAAEADALVDATYPLFLECGRQLSPQFLDRARAERPVAERDVAFLAAVRPSAVRLWPA